ncbi:hypothetical protein NSK_005307 [Nannochloropsis salina CCMP1776]|uniref:Uncharacterized protein n=1 Tax=Nannochloropsis salina CCMP1776 TaxID=1027361 RepID=A0A4D9CVZ7_9STRA|nr:hypothetical protein NSK_005307 [Nannochloropsis salina CCMP1776]|eukprot:TFJ83402.1 hypothetical protein NSK_005307 [Nannochloropsis salina CCMP1776]
MGDLNNKLCEIYRALALGTAEFETEPPLTIVQALLPEEVNDPNAPYHFQVDPRLDAAQEVKRVLAQNPVRRGGREDERAGGRGDNCLSPASLIINAHHHIVLILPPSLPTSLPTSSLPPGTVR